MKKINKKIVVFVVMSVILAVIPNVAGAGNGNIGFAWDANTEPDLAGYKVYYKPNQSGAPYDGVGCDQGPSPITYYIEAGHGEFSLDDPSNPSVSLSGLVAGVDYYFVCTAFDIYGNESIYSNELRLTAVVAYYDGDLQNTNNWSIFDSVPTGAEINIVEDDEKGYVYEFTGQGTLNAFRLSNDGLDNWHDTLSKFGEISFKSGQRIKFYFEILVENEITHEEFRRLLVYESVNYSNYGNALEIHNGFGWDYVDGLWHTMSFDLEKDLHRAQPKMILKEINGFYFRGTGRIDHIFLKENEISVYEIADAGGTWLWDIIDSDPAGAQILNVDHPQYGRMIKTIGQGTANAFQLYKPDGTEWHNANQGFFSFDYIADNILNQYFLKLDTTVGIRYIRWDFSDDIPLGTGQVIKIGLGSQNADGLKHSVTDFDIDTVVGLAQPGIEVISIEGFIVRGSGYFDNISLTSCPSVRVYENLLYGLSPGWYLYNLEDPGITVEEVYDAELGRSAVELNSDNAKRCHQLFKPNSDPWNNHKKTIAEFRVKNLGPLVPIKIYFWAWTSAQRYRYMVYTDEFVDRLGTGGEIHHGLHESTSDGQWHFFNVDLQSDLEEALPGEEILSVDAFLIRAYHTRITDIQLTE